MIDETTELQAIMDEFEHECFMLRVEASETRARDDIVRKSYERIRDEFAGRIAETLGEKPRDKTEEWLLKACNRATQDYVAQLEQEVDELKGKLEAATLGGELNPDGLPNGLTISDDGTLLNWRGENYVKQSTLVGGTLTAERVREVIRKYAADDSCYIFEVYGEMCGPIADELNAELGRGTCEVVGDYYSDDDYMLRLSCGHSAHWPAPTFCDTCGKRIRKAVER